MVSIYRSVRGDVFFDGWYIALYSGNATGNGHFKEVICCSHLSCVLFCLLVLISAKCDVSFLFGDSVN